MTPATAQDTDSERTFYQLLGENRRSLEQVKAEQARELERKLVEEMREKLLWEPQVRLFNIPSTKVVETFDGGIQEVLREHKDSFSVTRKIGLLVDKELSEGLITILTSKGVVTHPRLQYRSPSQDNFGVVNFANPNPSFCYDHAEHAYHTILHRALRQRAARINQWGVQNYLDNVLGRPVKDSSRTIEGLKVSGGIAKRDVFASSCGGLFSINRNKTIHFLEGEEFEQSFSSACDALDESYASQQKKNGNQPVPVLLVPTQRGDIFPTNPNTRFFAGYVPSRLLGEGPLSAYVKMYSERSD